MSREWYIRTDKRHVEGTFGDSNTAPERFSDTLRRNYKKYILWAVEIAVVIALFVLAFPVMFPKNTADYTVTLVTQNAVSDKGYTQLLKALTASGVDRNGDGEVQIEVRKLVIASAEEGLRNPALEQLITTLKTDEYSLLAMEPAVYSRYVKAYTAEGASLFEPLPFATAENLWEQPKTAQLPALLWGVRALPQAGDTAKQTQKAHLLLLQNLANTQ